MKVSSSPVSTEQALADAAELETVLGEIANGRRKPANIPMQPMCGSIQFARDVAAREKAAKETE